MSAPKAPAIPEHRVREAQRAMSDRYPVAASLWPSGFADPHTIAAVDAVRAVEGLAPGGLDADLLDLLGVPLD